MKITLKGEELEIAGVQLEVGNTAPDFTLKNLKDETVRLSDFAGKPVLISVVPDIDTRVCAIQTKRFNQEAAQIENVQFLTISNNTKAEQENWCAAEGVDMQMLHDTDNVFGEAYGLVIPAMNRLARAIFVVDADGKLSYQEIVSEVSNEPDYQTALDKAKELV